MSEGSSTFDVTENPEHAPHRQLSPWDVRAAESVAKVLTESYGITVDIESFAAFVHDEVADAAATRGITPADVQAQFVTEEYASRLAAVIVAGAAAFSRTQAVRVPFILIPEICRVLSLSGLVSLANGDTNTAKIAMEHVAILTSQANAGLSCGGMAGAVEVSGATCAGVVTVLEWTVTAVKTGDYDKAPSGQPVEPLLPVIEDVIEVLRR